LARIQMAAFGRTDTFRSKRVPFYLYIDEFQDFATDSFLQILAQSRKYKLPLILAHQNLAQLTPNLRASILTNCSLQAYFRVSRDDASVLAKESMASIFNNPPGWEWYIQQLQELTPTWCVIKNHVEGGVIKIKTLDLPPPHEMAEKSEEEFAAEVTAANIGGSYLRSRESVEEEFEKRREELMKLDEPESFRHKDTGEEDTRDSPLLKG